MEHSEKLAAFKQFAEGKGHKVEGALVIFEQDEAAARAFSAEAQQAGFDTVLDSNQAGSYSGLDDLSKLPTYWFVRLNAQ